MLGEPLAQEATLTAYYDSNPKPLWYTQAGFANRQKLLAFIQAVEDEGLLPQDYHLHALTAQCAGDSMAVELQKIVTCC